MTHDKDSVFNDDSKDSGNVKPQNINLTSALDVSSHDDEALHCVNDLIHQIVTTFGEEKSKQSEQKHDLLKQLNTPKEILRRLETVNVVNYLDEVSSKPSVSAVEAKIEENKTFLSIAKSGRKSTESHPYAEEKYPSSEILRRALLKGKLGGNNDELIKTGCDTMAKELKIIRGIENYVNDLVNEVQVVFERENLYTPSKKGYQRYESPEILKKTKRSIEIQDQFAHTKKSLDFGKRTDNTDKEDGQSMVTSEHKVNQNVIPSLDYLYQAKLSPISDDEDTEHSQEQTKESEPSDHFEETKNSIGMLGKEIASKDNLASSSKSPISENATMQMNLQQLIKTAVENEFSLKPGTISSPKHDCDKETGITIDETGRSKTNETLESNVQAERIPNHQEPVTDIHTERSVNKTPITNSQPSEAKQAAEYIKNIVQILMQPKQDCNAILHDLQIITYFIDVIGFLNDQLKTGIVAIFLEQRELNRTTSCVYESYVLLHFRRLPNLDINGIDIRVFGKGLLQDLKGLKIKVSMLFREYNLFRLKFLRNSVKFASIPFELLIGDVKNSWIVTLAKSAGEKIVEEFKNKDQLDEMCMTIVEKRKRLVGYAEEFNENIALLDEASKVEG